MRGHSATIISVLAIALASATMAQVPVPPKAPAAPAAPGAPAAPVAPAPPGAPTIRPTPTPPPITLAPGDRAPAFKPEEWIKGKPIDGFEAGKVHVIEFWATWCGPCIAAMPHLTELQKKHPEVIFIGLAGSERIPKDATEDGRLSKVRDFVSSKGDVMGYRVAFTPERTIPTEWMTAAGQNGIPCTFLVGADGHIEWIGHPSALDEPLARVLAGSWDRAAEAERAKTAAQMRKKNAEASLALAKARAAKDWDGAIRIFDELIASSPTNIPARLERYQLIAGLANRPELAAVAGPELYEQIRDSPGALNQIAWFIVDDPTVKTRDLNLALKCAERANELTDNDDPAMLDTLARIWWEKGDRAKAIEFQSKAVRELGDDETRMAKDIREALQRYQAPAKP